AAPAFAHGRDRGLRTEDCALQVGVEDEVDRLLVLLLEVGVDRDGGVRHHYVEPAELRARQLDEAAYVRRRAHVPDRRHRRCARPPPRVRARELWRVDERFLEEAQDDATLLAIRDMEEAGVDVISDGEMRRESYSNRFATALDGVDLDKPGVAIDRTGHENP